jgi:hypothetical protein
MTCVFYITYLHEINMKLFHINFKKNIQPIPDTDQVLLILYVVFQIDQ